jgi:branched-chain amino acid transport system ATP-binding protein
LKNTILEINNLCKSFGGVKAIDDFSIKLEEGKIHGLIGPNGAGKTTIFNNITGIYKPTSGNILFLGKDIANKKSYEVAQLGIGRTFQNIRLFSNLSVLDNVIIASNMEAKYNIFSAITRLGNYKKIEVSIKNKAMDLLDIFGLVDLCKAKAGSLPYGHQRKLEIARAMAINPKVLLLDEPAAGMNSEESEELVKFIRSIKDKFNLTILMIEHHMDVVAGLSDRVTVLNFGKTLIEGTAEEIKKDIRVIDAYLGGEENISAKS